MARAGSSSQAGLERERGWSARRVLLAKQEGIPTVEIGHTPTEISEIVDFGFRGSPGRILGLICEVFAQLRGRMTLAFRK